MSRKIPAVLVPLVAVLAGALLVPGAGLAHGRLSTRIVVMRSIAGFTDGMTPRAVERRLGRPSETIRVGGRIAQLTYQSAGLAFDFFDNSAADPADDVSTTSSRYRTSKGIHVGSTARALHRAYRGLKCHMGLCDLYQGAPGAPGSMDTAFTLFGGHVDSIQIQKVYE